MPKLVEREAPEASASPETDYFLWTQSQAALIRAGRWSALDRETLAEEIADWGGSQKSEIRSRLNVLLQWEHQPQQRKYGWRATIVEQRVSLDDDRDDEPEPARLAGGGLKQGLSPRPGAGGRRDRPAGAEFSAGLPLYPGADPR